MKKFYALVGFIGLLSSANAQQLLTFDPAIDTAYFQRTVKTPSSPIITQILMKGLVTQVEAVEPGGTQGTHTAKDWNDFIGFTPDETGNSLGWISVNHEMRKRDADLGDGGGMTVFRVERDADNDSLIVMDQTLSDGRQGKFFAVDFVNTVGETGMNCGGVVSAKDGRIWTAEEWFVGSNASARACFPCFGDSIGLSDTSDFSVPSTAIDGFAGETIERYQNLNYMVEIDPREAVAVRKQYNWGKLGWEGGTVLPDDKTVLLGEDATPGWFIKFVADTEGDFTSGDLFVYKHDAADPWVQIDNDDFDDVLNVTDQAVAAGATMYNRLEWVSYDSINNKVYFTETGRDFPGGRWRGESEDGAVHSPHTIARANAQGTHPDSSDYVDFYGRVMVYDPVTEEVDVLIHGGPEYHSDTNLALSNYPDVHLSNPDGVGVLSVGGHSYIMIQEDLNGSTFGRVPAETAPNRACEMFLLDADISSPSYDDLIRIAVVPVGAEVTGAAATRDGKTILLNSQHPSDLNPAPYNTSITLALTGWDDGMIPSYLSKPELDETTFDVFPNPVSQMLYFSRAEDVALYDMNGRRIRVFRQKTAIDMTQINPGVYFVQNAEGITHKLVVE